MSLMRLSILTAVTMIAFASNSLLCRLALSVEGIDAASFTSIRVLSGAVTLAGLVFAFGRVRSLGGNWLSAIALFVYAAGFSFAYIELPAATGALLLFGAVQCTMIGYGVLRGERMNCMQFIGVAVAVVGLVWLLLPGLSAPPLLSAALMLAAGVSWGAYSLRGRGAADATRETAGNFVRAIPFALLVSAGWSGSIELNAAGIGYAVASGALTSGAGYAIWYTALPELSATTAATVQLSVPALAAAGGVVFLGEPITFRLGIASLAILGGVALFILSKGGVNGASRNFAVDASAEADRH